MDDSEDTKEKAILEFDLTDRDSRERLVDSIKGPDRKLQIDTLYDTVFRKYLKYGTNGKRPLSEEEMELVQEIWEMTSTHLDE